MKHIVEKIIPSVFDNEMDATNILIDRVRLNDIVVINNKDYTVIKINDVGGCLMGVDGDEYYFGFNNIDYNTTQLTINASDFNIELSPIMKLINITGYSARRFARNFNIPIRTIKNWCSGISNPPKYVLDLLEYKIKVSTLFDLKSMLPTIKFELNIAIDKLIQCTTEFKCEPVPFENIFFPNDEQLEILKNSTQIGDTLINLKQLKERGNKEQLSAWEYYCNCYNKQNKIKNRIDKLQQELKPHHYK